MVKSKLNLSIDTDLLLLAKGSGLNLSQEFEEWIRIRLKQNLDQEKEIDLDLEVAKHHQAIAKLQSKKQLVDNQDQQKQEEVMIIDNIIDNQLKYSKPEDIPEIRSKGIIYLFKKKFNETLTTEQAIKLLTDRINERDSEAKKLSEVKE